MMMNMTISAMMTLMMNGDRRGSRRDRPDAVG